ncbi:MAG TPA: hypothetical protein PLS94_06265 [Prolixibacteraceae bacterium]|nr:hypothetical protein [Prolixibacteraceae bacterium]HPR61252.1 hypothetical protein [Prolixibacteraceae bacterium]
MKNSWIRKILAGLSFTSVLFVFQACYGTPQDFGLDLLIEGQVKAENTGLPLQNIKVSVSNNSQYAYTNQNGEFSFYTERTENIALTFADTDSLQNGLYVSKDTLLNNAAEKVFVSISLSESK